MRNPGAPMARRPGFEPIKATYIDDPIYTPPKSTPQCPSLSRLRLLAKQMHSLGERPLFEYLAEIIAGADPVARLEAYARVASLADFIAVNGGNKLPGCPRLINGGRR